MSEFQHLKFHSANQTAQVAIRSLPSNIIDFELMEELSRALDRAASDVILVISSALPHFSMGVDIKIHTPDLVPEMLKQFHEVVRKLYHFPGISVCVLHGYALGGGLELALSCDLLLADQNAHLGFPEIRLACFPPVAAVLLPRRIGRKAFDLLICGETVTAERAFELGLIDRVFQENDREQVVSQFLEKITANSFDALRALKKAMRRSEAFDFDGALQEAETVYRSDLLGSPDLLEGVEAFLQKRPPKFRR